MKTFLYCVLTPWALLCASVLGRIGTSALAGDEPHSALPISVPPAGTLELQSPWIDSTLASMTLEEKVGQVIMPGAYGIYLSTESDEYARLEHLVKDLRVGGCVMFQGDVYEEAMMINRLQKLAKVPLLIAADMERGPAMRIRRATYFPDAMAIGATRNPEYAYKAGRATAEEARAIGIHQNYAPVADINSNPMNPVINTRAFGDDPGLVAEMVNAFVRGTNDGGVVSTAKHFPGHGDTGIDSHLDLPVLPLDNNRLQSVELVSFKSAISGGVISMMIGHLEVPAIDESGGVPATLSHKVVTELLENRLGFSGLIVSDAMVMAGIAKGYSIGESSVKAINAGIDLLLLPGDETIAANALASAVRRGGIPEARLNECVRKILAVKQWLHLDRERLVDVERISERVATREHWNLAKEIARKSVTVVQNTQALLPLHHFENRKIVSVIVSDIDDNRIDVNRPGYQYPNELAGSYFTHQLVKRQKGLEKLQLAPGSNDLDIDAALSAVRQSDIVILPLYVKVRTSSGKIDMPANLARFMEQVSQVQKPTIIISFGNPYLAGQFPWANAIMCAYADGEVAVESAVEALYGEIPVSGKLPVTVSSKFPFGTGIEYQQTQLRYDDPSSAGFDVQRLRKVDDIVNAAIRDSAFPGAQVVVAKDGMVVYDQSFGTYTYDLSSREINRATLYDLASVTKVIATTSAVMKLYDEKKLLLDDRVGAYIPQFSQGAKAGITIRHLLTHTSGLPPFRKLWEISRTSQEALDSVYATSLVAAPGDTMIYSDLGMITMGKIIEKITGMPLDVYVKKEFFDPLGMRTTGFNPPASMRSRIAPTEIDTTWRKALVQGTVHDENAALLGGVSGHAGLFSSASELAIYMQMLVNGGTYGGVRYIRESTVREFTRQQSSSSSRALGWDTKSPKGSSAGSLFSSSSFGHTGFTGTSIWVDPERKLFVIFLTNRVHPTRASTKISAVRPALHDAVVNALLDSQK